MAIYGKSTHKAEHGAITFEDSQVSSPNPIANYFNRQFTTSKLDRHTSSLETRLVSREIKRKSTTSAVTFTTDRVTKVISSCRNTRAFRPVKLSILHLKHFGSRAIEYLTALFNDSRHILSDFVELEVIHCHPNPEARQGLLSCWHVIMSLSHSSVQQRKLRRLSYFPPLTTTCFHPHINTVSDPDTLPLLFLIQLMSDITQVSIKRNLLIIVFVAVDLTAAFDTVNHNVLLSKIVRSTLPEATCRWLSNYIRGRQSVTSCIFVKSKPRIVHTGVLQGSKMSPTLFSFYIADMPWPTEPVKRI